MDLQSYVLLPIILGILVGIVDWLSIREDFPALKKATYLNTASTGLLSEGAIAVAEGFLRERRYGGIKWLDWYSTMDVDLRKKVSILLGCRTDEVGFVPNTTTGINMIAHSIKWRKGGNIVTTDMEFPANLFPWQVVAHIYGLEVRYARSIGGIIPLGEFERAVDENTIAIVVSWVEFSNGFTIDLNGLSKIARRHGSYLIVDGIQGVGSIPINPRGVGVDVLVCGMQKWLLGTGGGFIYVEKNLLSELEIHFGGWLADETPFDFSFREFKPSLSARRFELGTPSFIDFHIANHSIGFILDIGIDKIHHRNRVLIKYLLDCLEELPRVEICTPEDSRSSIVLIRTGRDREIVDRMREKNIIVSYRAGGIRISPHFYNTEEDIDVFISELKHHIH